MIRFFLKRSATKLKPSNGFEAAVKILFRFFLIIGFALTIFYSKAYSANLSSKESSADLAVLKQISFENDHLNISLSQKTEFKIFALNEPQRLVIDLKNTKFSDSFEQKKLPQFVDNFRFRKHQNDLRIVFEISEPINVIKTSFNENSNVISGELINQNPREKIETKLADSTKSTAITKKIDEKPKTPALDDDLIIEKNGNVLRKYKIRTAGNKKYDGKSDKQNTKQTSSKNKVKNPVIVIDAGHGGKDPGTIGIFAHSKEKNITLAYAKELAKNLQQNPNYQVFLTRDSDEFLPLKERVSRARQKKADLFISLHANAIDDADVSGFSIYTLSENSSDKQAELLAQKENRADIINGIDFSGASRDVVKTLIDLAQRESKNSSSSFAKFTIDEIESSEIKILDNTHRFAGFMVLTAPDMASVLIELGYLSNKAEEKLINSLGYRRMIAKNLAQAVDKYFATNPL